MTTVHVNPPEGEALPEGLLRRAVERTLEAEGCPDGEISLTFLPDPGIAGMNRRWLGRDGPTDVIAFALHDEGDAPLGDVYIGREQARRQAADLGVDEVEELVRLAVHGTLHVVGHDHPDGPGREESEHFRRQEALVREVLRAEGRR